MILAAVSFWLCTATIVYAYIGYPLFLAAAARFYRCPVRTAPVEPPITLLITAYNEAQSMQQKLTNSLELDYPADKLQILVTSDGSTDATADIVLACGDSRVQSNILETRRGKMQAILSAMPLVSGEVIVFSDATAMYGKGALRAFARNFADDEVGGVSGTLILSGGAEANQAKLKVGEGAYWRYETLLRSLESATGSTIIAPGSIYAIRRALFASPPADTIADDFAVTLGIIEQGYRMVWEEGAVATEKVSMTLSEEYERKVRIVAGGIQTLLRFRHLMLPSRGLTAVKLVSHKLLRWLVPLAMLGAAATNGLLLSAGHLYKVTMVLQLLFYGLASAGYGFERMGRRSEPSRGVSRLPTLVFHFCAINLAAMEGWYRQLTHSQPVKWTKAGRR